jgi:glycosyltransferase involved in cell wall biosynthesis
VRGDGITLMGSVSESELLALYSCADALLYPSLFEGFGLPVLEAMACGTPVIASSTSAIPEVAGDAAILVDPANASRIAAALHRLLEDGSYRSELSRRGIAQAARFSWQETARRTADVYRSV